MWCDAEQLEAKQKEEEWMNGKWGLWVTQFIDKKHETSQWKKHKNGIGEKVNDKDEIELSWRWKQQMKKIKLHILVFFSIQSSKRRKYGWCCSWDGWLWWILMVEDLTFYTATSCSANPHHFRCSHFPCKTNPIKIC